MQRNRFGAPPPFRSRSLSASPHISSHTSSRELLTPDELAIQGVEQFDQQIEAQVQAKVDSIRSRSPSLREVCGAGLGVPDAPSPTPSLIALPPATTLTCNARPNNEPTSNPTIPRVVQTNLRPVPWLNNQMNLRLPLLRPRPYPQWHQRQHPAPTPITTGAGTAVSAMERATRHAYVRAVHRMGLRCTTSPCVPQPSYRRDSTEHRVRSSWL